LRPKHTLAALIAGFAVLFILALTFSSCSDDEDTQYSFSGNFVGVRTLSTGDTDSIRFAFVQSGTRNNLLTGLLTYKGRTYEIGDGRITKDAFSFFSREDTTQINWAGNINNKSDELSGRFSSSKLGGTFTATRW
jgi:hypothetical protein